MATFRAKWRAEVTESEERRGEAMTAYRAGVRERKAEREAVRAVDKSATEAKTDTKLKQLRVAKQLRADLSRKSVELRLTRVAERRAKWLSSLEAASAQWIPETEIETLITPDLFRVKYAWQFEKWFAVKENKRSLWEAARRGEGRGGDKKGGRAPMKAVLLGEEDAGFDSTWESDTEGMEGEGERPAGAIIAEEVTRGEDSEASRAAIALAVARDAARERSALFVEPAYTSDGVLIGDLTSRVDKMSRGSGIQVWFLVATTCVGDVHTYQVLRVCSWLSCLSKKRRNNWWKIMKHTWLPLRLAHLHLHHPRTTGNVLLRMHTLPL
jgi:hypothetical protein